MKHPLKNLTESLASPRHGRAGPASRWVSFAVLLGAGAVACSDEESSPTASVAATPPVTGDQVIPAGGTGANEAVAKPSGTPAEDTPSVAEMAPLPELIAGGAGGGGAAEAAAAVDGGVMAGGAGGAGGALGMGGAGGTPEDEWVPLFNGVNLDGWVVHGTTETLFAVENGEIHVYPTQADQSNQPQANLRNLTSLGGKYTLHVEYRWGDARFVPRAQDDRDAGILFHIAGNITQVWPDSLEHQLGASQLGGQYVAGDLFVLGGPTSAQTMNANGQLQTFSNGGRATTRVHAENALGEWNTVEIIIDGAAEAIYMINGIEANRIFNMTYNGQPLSEGFISVQAEWAELYYRNIQYKLNE
jgi:hypothetical protein